MFWPSQCLLAANRLHQVPLSPRSGVLPTFRSSRCIPVDCHFHPHGSPGLDRSRSLAFDSPTPSEAGGILRYVCYPCLISAESAPPGLDQAPGSSYPSQCAVSGAASWSIGLGKIFPSFRRFPSRRLHPCGYPSVDRGVTTLLSIASAGVARPRARYARNPNPSGRDCTPWPPPSCARFLLLHPSIARRTFRLSAADFPRLLDSRRTEFPLCLQAFPSRFSGPRRPGCEIWLHTKAGMLGLHTTPVARVRQHCLTAYHLERGPKGLAPRQASRLSQRARESRLERILPFPFLGPGLQASRAT
jgi:hypothetical protein